MGSLDLVTSTIDFGGVPPGSQGPDISVDPSFGPPGISFAGGVQIREVAADTALSAQVIDGSGHFSLRDITVMEWTLEDVDPTELPRGHHGRPPQVKVLEIVAQSDGSAPVRVTKGQFVLVRVAYAAGFTPGTFTGTLEISGAAFDTETLTMSLFLGSVLTEWAQSPLVITQGQTASLGLFVSAVAGPDTTVNYEMSRTQLHSGILLVNEPVSIATNQGNKVLEFRADPAAQLGANTLAIDQIAFNKRRGLLLPVVVVAAPQAGGVDPQRVDPVDVAWGFSTERVCQLTGGLDPTGLPHLNDTTGFDMLGTDLGSSFDHFVAGERRTYFFFGDSDDSDPNGGDFGDSIAYTVDDDPEPNGIHLRFVIGDNNWRRLTIPGVDLGIFAVPTGGFSHADRLFVFATTDCDPDRPPGRIMGRSVLASAVDAGQDFALHYDVSNNLADWREDGRGGGKFINVSPFKVANDDWPGLPENALRGSEGLVIAASGKYRNSAPYLAYVPLLPGQIPARSDWRYFAGAGLWEPGFGPMGPPHWSVAESDAVPLFDADTIGELSFSWNEHLRRWLLVYGGFVADRYGMVLRSAGWPWGPWSTEPQLLFESTRDYAQGQYMFECGPYGAYVISRYNRYDAVQRRATIYYTLSNGNCWPKGQGDKPASRYQVHLMRSRLELVRKP